MLTEAVATLADWLGPDAEVRCCLRWVQGDVNHSTVHPTAWPRSLFFPLSVLFHCTQASRLTPLNVVVPSYRCDPTVLARITRLHAECASVHILIVVDDPTSPNLPAVKRLEDHSINHVVR